MRLNEFIDHQGDECERKERALHVVEQHEPQIRNGAQDQRYIPGYL